MIILDEATADEMAETVRNLMCHYHYNPNSSDFVCEFCYEHARTNTDLNINHRADCAGIKYLAILEGREEGITVRNTIPGPPV